MQQPFILTHSQRIVNHTLALELIRIYTTASYHFAAGSASFFSSYTRT